MIPHPDRTADMTISEAQAYRAGVADALAWRPIETAPADSDALLVWDPEGDGEWSLAVWDNGWIAYPGGWPIAPTHWQPLPPPPEPTP